MKFQLLMGILLGSMMLQGCSGEASEKMEVPSEYELLEGTTNDLQSYMENIDISKLDGTLSNGLISIDFTTSPSSLTVNETSTLSIHITSNEESVTDATVVFEIWPAGETDSIQVDAKPDHEGNYSLAGTFSQPGQYSLVAHVSALNIHEMQTFQFSIQ